jgi:hypothetical protein
MQQGFWDLVVVQGVLLPFTDIPCFARSCCRAAAVGLKLFF